MALLNPGVICQAQTARSFASTVESGVELQLDAASAINAAIETFLYSTTLSVSGESSEDIQNLMNLLKNLGYTASLSGTTLTMSW